MTEVGLQLRTEFLVAADVWLWGCRLEHQDYDSLQFQPPSGKKWPLGGCSLWPQLRGGQNVQHNLLTSVLAQCGALFIL